MIIGVGIDVVETSRIARALARYGDRFEARVFTRRELLACGGRVDRIQSLAARFAGKEACLKALGTGWVKGLSLKHVEILKGDSGSPEIQLSGGAAERARERGVARLHVSLSHEREYAAAVVVLERGP